MVLNEYYNTDTFNSSLHTTKKCEVITSLFDKSRDKLVEVLSETDNSIVVECAFTDIVQSILKIGNMVFCKSFELWLEMNEEKTSEKT
ncbi:MAG TPA: hypothetical protein VH415_13705 [Nitrososphaeraceae archaeon]